MKKAIKSTFVKGLSLLLVLVMVISVPISALAATDTAATEVIEAAEEDYSIALAASSAKDAMIDTDIFRALLYLGYDSDGYLRNNDLIFEPAYIASGLKNRHPASLTGVPYDSVGTASGTQTSTSNTGLAGVTSATGSYPNVHYFKNGETRNGVSGYGIGLDCADFAAYYLTNYLPNIVGEDISPLTELRASKYSGYTFDHMDFWPTARQDMVDAGFVRLYTATVVDFNTAHISEYTNPEGQVKTDNIYTHIKPGTLIQMGNEGDETLHYSIFLGLYNGQPYIVHSSTPGRGPEVSIVEYSAPANSSSNKASVPLYFYEFTFDEEQYGSIEIYKKGSDGKALAGAKFVALHQETGRVRELTTDSSGYATLDELPFGTYTITETAAPEGYVKSDETWTVTLSAANPTGGGTLMVTNKKAVGAIQMFKYNADASARISGAVFACKNVSTGVTYYRYDVDEGSITFTDPVSGKSVTANSDTAGNGSSTFAGLPLGTYHVYEAKAPTGYLRDTTIVTVVLEEDGQKEFVLKPADGNYTDGYLDADGNPYHLFTNTPYGGIRVYKYNSDASALIPGAVFAFVNVGTGEARYLYDTDTGSISVIDPVTGETVTANADTIGNGSSTLSGIPLGTYHIYEVKAPEGYVRDETIVTVELTTPGQMEYILKPSDGNYTDAYLDADGNPYHLFTNAAYGSLIIKKETTDGSSVAGWQFEVTDSSGNLIDTYTTGEDGTITVDLAPGIYTVTEIIPEDSAYKVEGENPQTVTVEENGVASVTFTNTLKTGSLLIQKETNTGSDLGGWKVNVYQGSVADENLLPGSPFATDVNGQILIEDLLPGTYIVVEEDANSEYWVCDVSEKEVTVAADKAARVHILNVVYGKLQIRKVMTDGADPSGWQFNIYDTQRNLVAGSPFTTDANGYIDVGNLQPGTYIVQEILPADSDYVVVGSLQQKIQVSAEKISTVTFTNAPKTGDLLIQKDTNTGNDLEGWKVNVYKDSVSADNLLDGSPFVTDENGQILLEDLRIGTYIAVEVDEGKDLWICDVAEKQAIVTYNSVTQIDISNIQLGRGQIIKQTTNGGTVAGWMFEVKNEAGDLVGNYITDDTGVITLDLMPGIYYVTETGPIDEYWSLDTETKTLIITAGQISSVTCTNRWFGKGLLIKEMADGSSPAGWEFSIYRAGDNTLVGTYVTGEDGTVVTELLEPGEYLIYENLPEDSLYECVGENPQCVTVTAGQTTSFVFTNTLRPGKISVTKVNTEGELLAGAKFLLEWSDDDGATWTAVTHSTDGSIAIGSCSSADLENGCLTTGSTGIVEFTDLHPGLQYRVTELEAPNGYLLLADYAFTGNLPVADLTVSLTVHNARSYTYPVTGAEDSFPSVFFIAMTLLMIAVMVLLSSIRKPVFNAANVENKFKGENKQ